jgi:predicted exporter
LNFTPLVLARLQQFNLDDHFQLYDGYIVTSDFKHLLVFVTPEISSRETKENTQLLKGLDGLLFDLNTAQDSISAEYFGAAMVAVDNALQVRKDVTLTVSIAVLILFLLILHFFRRPRVFIYLILPTLLGALVALGILGWAFSSVSIISIGIGSVLLGITIDYALHIFTHLRDTGDRKQALRELTWPILVSSITTAAAFACLLVVRSDGLHHLGIFAALSVTATAVFALIILPLLPVKLRSASGARVTFIEKCAAYPIHTKKWWRIALLIVSVLCLFGAGKVAFEDDLYKINFMSARTTAAEAQLNRLTSTTHRGVYLASSGSNLEEALGYEKEFPRRRLAL